MHLTTACESLYRESCMGAVTFLGQKKLATESDPAIGWAAISLAGP